MRNQSDELDVEEERLFENISTEEMAQKLRLAPEKFLTLATNSALVLPSNAAIDDPAREALYFHQDAKELLFALREANIPAQFYDDGRPKRGIDFRSGDVILSPLLFVGQEVLKGGLAALGAWIVNKWLTGPKADPPTIRVQYILFENGVVKKWVSIKGTAKKVADLVRGIDGQNDGAVHSRKRIGKQS